MDYFVWCLLSSSTQKAYHHTNSSTEDVNIIVIQRLLARIYLVSAIATKQLVHDTRPFVFVSIVFTTSTSSVYLPSSVTSICKAIDDEFATTWIQWLVFGLSRNKLLLLFIFIIVIIYFVNLARFHYSKFLPRRVSNLILIEGVECSCCRRLFATTSWFIPFFFRAAPQSALDIIIISSWCRKRPCWPNIVYGS